MDKEDVLFAWTTFVRWLESSRLHQATFVWLVLVIVDGAILFMCMTGMLQLELTDDELKIWTEQTSQIMNVLFTGMALWNHFLFPWPGGRLWLALYYCFAGPSYLHDLRRSRGEKLLGNGTLAAVLFLLNLNCFAQYPMFFYMWSYGPDTRPMLGVVVPLVSSLGSGIGAAVVEARALPRRQSLPGHHLVDSIILKPDGGASTLLW